MIYNKKSPVESSAGLWGIKKLGIQNVVSKIIVISGSVINHPVLIPFFSSFIFKLVASE
jgi:hypothetical protein